MFLLEELVKGFLKKRLKIFINLSLLNRSKSLNKILILTV